jgi:hypothetical protein
LEEHVEWLVALCPGNDLTWRFPLIIEALPRQHSRSCIIEGRQSPATMTAFHLSSGYGTDARTPAACSSMRLTWSRANGDDLRRDRLVGRKDTLASILAKAGHGLQLDEHLEGEDCVSARLQAWARGHRVEGKGTRLITPGACADDLK